MMGAIERVLVRRYGQPRLSEEHGYSRLEWNEFGCSEYALLYKWPTAGLAVGSPSLRHLYGDSSGGFLATDCLKVALLDGPGIFGLYSIAELQSQPEIRDIQSAASDVTFFMDAANVWFFGVRERDLYEFDSATSELKRLGDVSQSLERIIDLWASRGGSQSESSVIGT